MPIGNGGSVSSSLKIFENPSLNPHESYPIILLKFDYNTNDP